MRIPRSPPRTKLPYDLPSFLLDARLAASLRAAEHPTIHDCDPIMPRAVILANGTPPPLAAIRRAISTSDLFVCADGGANTARDLGLRPGALIGDFDSATPETLAHFRDVPQIRDTDLERTDLEKAILYALDRGPFEEITLLGAG